MEKEIKINLVPREQISEEFACVMITCGNICAWCNSLEPTINAFDDALRKYR